jgi:hypothetical protein
MSEQGWVAVDIPTDPEITGGYDRGTRWQVRRGLLNGGRIFTVIGWARSIRAHEHEVNEHGREVTCEYGDQCDNLVDDEGPVGRFDDQDPGDETLKWYPGQSMSCLEPLEEAR